MAENHQFKTALAKAMQICSRREMCINDIEMKLESWGVTKIEAHKILDILLKENFINEDRYAKAFVKDKFSYNKWGKIKIASHLKTKRISPATISMALDSIDNDQYIETIEALLKSHKKSIKAKNSYEFKAKLMRFGLSRGFESHLLYELLGDNYTDEN
jgi:regulatory protein